MLTETLFQVLLVILIFAGVLFIVVFCRLYNVLADIKSITAVVSKRVQEVDEKVGELQTMVENCVETVKGFMLSFDFLKNIKNKISNLASQISESREGDKDEE